MRRLRGWAAVVVLAACGAGGGPGPGTNPIEIGGDGGSGGAGGSDAPPLTAAPQLLEFSWVCAGGSAREALTITNRRDEPWSVEIAADAPASVDPGTVTVPALGESVVSVLVSPLAGETDGVHSGQVVLKSADGDVTVPWTARVTHDPRGRPAALCGSEVPCTSLDAGVVPLGDEVDVTFDLVNDGCAAFSVTALIARGPAGGPAPELRVVDPGVPFTVGPGERRAVRLVFGPTATGEATGDIVVQTNTPSRDEVRLPWYGSGQP